MLGAMHGSTWGDVAGVVETTTSSPTFLDYGRKQLIFRVREGGSSPLNSVARLWELQIRRWVGRVHLNSCKLEKPEEKERKKRGERKSLLCLMPISMDRLVRRLVIQDPNVYQPIKAFL